MNIKGYKAENLMAKNQYFLYKVKECVSQELYEIKVNQEKRKTFFVINDLTIDVKYYWKIDK